MNKPSFSLITFLYNEIDLAESQLRRWAKDLTVLGVDFEIIAVDDGSSDGTAAVIKRLSKEIPQLKARFHDTNRGIGWAIHTARPMVTKDYVFMNDIDSHFDVTDLAAIIPLLATYDVVVAFRHDMSYRSKTLFSWLKSIVNYTVIKILFFSPVKDFQFVQFYPREFFCEGMELESASSFIPPECLLKAQSLGLRLGQVKVHYHSQYGRMRPGKCANFNSIAAGIKDIIRFWFRWNFCGARRKAATFYLAKWGKRRPWRE